MKKIHTLESLTAQAICQIEETLSAKVIWIDRARYKSMQKSEFPRISVLICRDRDDVAFFACNCPNLKFIFIVSVGVEKLPFSLLASKGITVAAPGGINAEIMSEYVFASILLFSARMRENILNQCRHYWKRYQCVDSLQGKTLLVVGCGHVGMLIAEKAKAFGMKVTGVKKHLTQLGCFDRILTLDEMEEVLPDMDFVECSIPLTEETHHLFDMHKFRQMKPSSVFINVSRGLLIDQRDLLMALKKRIIGGAVLDVFEHEPLPEDSEIWETPNLVITPHSSGRLNDFVSKTIPYFIANLQAWEEKLPLPNQVNLQDGY